MLVQFSLNEVTGLFPMKRVREGPKEVAPTSQMKRRAVDDVGSTFPSLLFSRFHIASLQFGSQDFPILIEDTLFLPPGLSYVENFISEEESQKLVRWLDDQNWSETLSRRTQHFGYAYSYKSRTVPEALGSLPDIFGPLLTNLKKYFSPDQIIVNGIRFILLLCVSFLFLLYTII